MLTLWVGRKIALKYRIILNPSANQSAAKKRFGNIKRLFNASGIDCDFSVTRHAKDATTLSAEAADLGYSAVIAVGGDGTINEVVNGLMQTSGNGKSLALGIIPAGTGNDFSDMAGLPREIEAAIRNIILNKTRQVDVGMVEIDDGKEKLFFDNNSALAMEPMVNLESSRFKRISGTPRYLAGLASALTKLRAWDMEIEWEGGSYSGQSLLLSVCNGPRAGSTFMMAPDAKIDDGLFDVILAPNLRMHRVLRILPRLFNGSHLSQPEVMHFRTHWLKISCPAGTPVHADGEMVATEAVSIAYSMLPGKLTLLSC